MVLQLAREDVQLSLMGCHCHPLTAHIGSTHHIVQHANAVHAQRTCHSPARVVCLEHVAHHVVLLGKHEVQQLQP
jgi:hypothetical protein